MHKKRKKKPLIDWYEYDLKNAYKILTSLDTSVKPSSFHIQIELNLDQKKSD